MADSATNALLTAMQYAAAAKFIDPLPIVRLSLHGDFPTLNPISSFSIDELKAEVAAREGEIERRIAEQESERIEREQKLYQEHLDARWQQCVRKWASKHGGLDSEQEWRNR